VSHLLRARARDGRKKTAKNSREAGAMASAYDDDAAFDDGDEDDYDSEEAQARAEEALESVSCCFFGCSLAALRVAAAAIVVSLNFATSENRGKKIELTTPP
jgi:hypothetical protein